MFLAKSYHRSWDTEVCILQADSRQGVIQRAEQLQRYLSAGPQVTLRDLAYTVNLQSRDAAYRLAIVASSLQEMGSRLASALQRLADPLCRRIKDPGGIYFFESPLGCQGKLAFLFPGEGSQYPNMLADLCLHFPEVRVWFDLIDRAFINHRRRYLPSQFIFPLLSGEAGDRIPDADRLWQMDGAVEAVFTASQALFSLLSSLEIRPQVVLGHSSGEYSALLASGALQVDSDERLIQHILDLNGVYEQLSAEGRIPEAVLLAVGGTDRALITAVIEQSDVPLYAAMDNCPHQIILCGPEKTITQAARQFQQRGAICNVLPFNRPYHTPLFEALCEPLREFFQRLDIVSPKTKLYSCTTTEPYPGDPDAIRKLAVAQWTRSVRFRETIEAMYEDGVRIFVEVGPRGNLTAFVEDILRGRPHVAVASNLPGRSGIVQLNHLVGLLAAHHVSMRLEHLYIRRTPNRVCLDAKLEAADRGGDEAGVMKLSLRLPLLRITSATVLQKTSSICRRQTQEDVPVKPILRDLTVSRAEAVGQAGSPSRVMTEYFQTMERFLDVQHEVMRAHFAGNGGLPDEVGVMDQVACRPTEAGRSAWAGELRLVESDAPQTSSGSGLPAATHLDSPRLAGADTTKTSRYPFIRTIVSLIPDRELIAFCDLDLEEDLFLHHHTLSAGISVTDPSLIGLPVVPLTIGMEMLAEAAAVLRPGKVVIGIAHLRAYRWMIIEHGRLRLRLTARYKTGDEVGVEIHEAEIESGSEIRPAYPIMEGTVIFGDSYPDAPPAQPLVLQGERSSKWPARRMYDGTGMFHGPLFRVVDSMDRTGTDGAESTMIGQSVRGFLRSYREPVFLVDPVLLDAMGQVVGYWTGDHFEVGLSVFPFRLERVLLFGSSLSAGVRATCRVRVTFVDDQWIRSNIDVVGGDGRLMVQMVQWEDRRMDMPRRFYDFRISPRDVSLSTLWSIPVKQLPMPELFQCCFMTRFSDEMFEAHGMIWLRVLAYMVLNWEERKVWQDLKGPTRRRIEWLMGRIVAKDAVRLLLKEHYGIALCPADIELMADEYGRPEVRGLWTGRINRAPVVSLAHAGDIAVAVVGMGGRCKGIGIDIERVGPIREDFKRLAFTSREQQLLASVGDSVREDWSIRLWCAKEAVAKALGRGMVGGPADLIVQEVDSHTGVAQVILSGQLAREFPALVGKPIVVYTAQEGELVVACSLFEHDRDGA